METVLSSRAGDVVISRDKPFVIIGERINPTGRKALGPEMAGGDFGRVKTDAITQVEAGAHMLDVNAGVPGADEAEIMKAAVQAVMEVVDVPLSIDSANPAAIEAGLATFEGKALVNSVTGEDASLERVLPLVEKHGAAVIAMANDEEGPSMDPDVRLRVAAKILQRAADHGVPAENILIDPLVFTVGADQNAGRIVLETMKKIRDELSVNMTCGASNVSYGLPDRHGVDVAFLPMAIMAGLTSAITNPLVTSVRKASLAADLLLGKDEWAMAWISAHRASEASGV